LRSVFQERGDLGAQLLDFGLLFPRGLKEDGQKDGVLGAAGLVRIRL
jgi:hypothetical protein